MNRITNNFRQEILEKITAPIIGVVFKQMRVTDKIPFEQGKVYKWCDIEHFFDYEYDGGYGGPDCHAVYIWTETESYFIKEYDGSTHICSVPRNPTNIIPDFI